MDVNNILCCSLNKAYAALESSRKGRLSDCELYKAALLQYQASILANPACLSESELETLSQKLQGECGCCQAPIVYEAPQTEEEIELICFRIALVISPLSPIGGPPIPLIDWTINTLDLITFVGPVMSGTYNGTGTMLNENGTALLTYNGTFSSLPYPDILDDFGNPYPVSWINSYCDGPTCWQAEFAKPDFTMTQMTINNAVVIDFSSTLGFDVNVTNPAHVTALEGLLQSIYGPQVVVTASIQPSTNWILIIENIYSPTLFGVFSLSGGFSFDAIACS